MSEFKKGDKVLVEAEITGGNLGGMYLVETDYGASSVVPKECVHPAITKTYEDGLNEAWETAKKIIDIHHTELNDFEYSDLFDGCVNHLEALKNLTAAEAASKITAWEDRKQIHVGDVVEASITKGVVTCIIDSHACVLSKDGKATYISTDNLTKTGQTIDADSFLKQIGGDVDD